MKKGSDAMKADLNIGVVFPQTEFGHDAGALKDYAQTAEGLGYTHILAYDHVLGANPNRPGGWSGPYTFDTPFLEPFVLFSFLAAVTSKIGLTTGVIILPQRQTALVAKQAATLDAISGGRVRLGVGLGWNEVEYIALNEDFHTRGRRIEEQVTVLRELFMRPLVTFGGRWHAIPDAGIKPLPVQRPIPIWFGGHAERQLLRAARLADGWMPNYRMAADAQPAIDLLSAALTRAGRSWAQFGVEARIAYGDGNPDTWQALMRDWQAAGARYFTLNTMGCGFASPAEHVTAIQRFARAVGVASA
ncbi:MAG: LLM class F420-dependent oxidoreductase [Candidatus Roseilinea sp.]|uniref:LLM class F420-dependent oxidoreductase n=1 Tax=Candidatus Roseilinea sp. TaxID=2838777 RepID=UPI004049F99C